MRRPEVKSLEAPGIDGGMVVLDFDVEGVVLGVEVVDARKLLDSVLLAGAERNAQ